MSPTEFHPVQNVNWYDAVLFCNWLSHREGLMPCYERTGEKEQISYQKGIEVWRLLQDANGYRLPTEAQWEYACRAGSVTNYCHGNDESLLHRYAAYKTDTTLIPGSRLPNAWGLFDMHSNVQDWCQVWKGPYGRDKAVIDPNVFQHAPGVMRAQRVARGGQFRLPSSEHLYSSARFGSSPTSRFRYCGFRVARNDPM